MTYKDWHEMLSFAWHDYQNSRRTFTGATLFLLVCRMEVVLFFEVEIPYLKVLSEAKVEEVEWAQVFFDWLNLIEGKILDAMSHGQ